LNARGVLLESEPTSVIVLKYIRDFPQSLLADAVIVPRCSYVCNSIYLSSYLSMLRNLRQITFKKRTKEKQEEDKNGDTTRKKNIDGLNLQIKKNKTKREKQQSDGE
jgi:hypothetical protein